LETIDKENKNQFTLNIENLGFIEQASKLLSISFLFALFPATPFPPRITLCPYLQGHQSPFQMIIISLIILS